MKEFRPRTHRSVDVAVDHGFFHERSFLNGLENLERVSKTIVSAAPAVMIDPGL